MTTLQEQCEEYNPIEHFIYGLKAPESRRQYPRRLKVFLDFFILINRPVCYLLMTITSALVTLVGRALIWLTGKCTSNSFYYLSSRELDCGIELAVKKAKKHLNASKLLANNEQYLSYASTLFLFALEEYGKSKILKKAKSPTKSIHLVPKNIFKGGDSHRKKIEEGRKDLTNKTIYVEAYIEKIENSSDGPKTISLKKDIKVSIGAHQTGKFTAAGYTDIQEEMRRRILYSDWDDSQRYWINEYHFKKDELERLISELEACLTT